MSSKCPVLELSPKLISTDQITVLQKVQYVKKNSDVNGKKGPQSRTICIFKNFCRLMSLWIFWKENYVGLVIIVINYDTRNLKFYAWKDSIRVIGHDALDRSDCIVLESFISHKCSLRTANWLGLVWSVQKWPKYFKIISYISRRLYMVKLSLYIGIQKQFNIFLTSLSLIFYEIKLCMI